MAGSAHRQKRPRGTVEELPSGALRVSVYAGIDPVTKRRHYLKEIVPPGVKPEVVMRRLGNEIDERRHPSTNATVDQLLDRHFEMATLERNTLASYTRYAKHHIRPLIGKRPVGSLDADLFDSYYAELRRCRAHCDRRPRLDHRTRRKHECDHRCTDHVCRPLSDSSIRHIHFILSGALKRAVRWRWISVNPIGQAEPPPAPKPSPCPPTPSEAARIITEAWRDPDWGALVWLVMVTGMRRGELCALRWRDLDLETGVLRVSRSIGQHGRETWEKDTKTHQQRRIALDPETVAVLTEHRQRWLQRVEVIETELSDDAYIFSWSLDGSEYLRPDSVTQKYRALVRGLGIETTLHKLRHYSATELIAAGVDVRTVAGRLGHGGGGTSTLRFYSAFVSESDQRAVASLASRMPPRPEAGSLPPRKREPHPFEELADTLEVAIEAGEFVVGGFLPGQKVLAADYGVSVSTAHRAAAELSKRGYVKVVVGHGWKVLERPDEPVMLDKPETLAPVEQAPAEPAHAGPGSGDMSAASPVLLELTIRHRGDVIARLTTHADPSDGEELRDLMLDAVLRRGGTEDEIAEYEMDLRRCGNPELITTFVAPRRRRKA